MPKKKKAEIVKRQKAKNEAAQKAKHTAIYFFNDPAATEILTGTEI